MLYRWSDLKQSNIGINEVFYKLKMTVPRSRATGSLSIWWRSQASTKTDSRRVGEVYLNAMIYGSGLSICSTLCPVKIPDWFKEGLIGYQVRSVKKPIICSGFITKHISKEEIWNPCAGSSRLVGYAFLGTILLKNTVSPMFPTSCISPASTEILNRHSCIFSGSFWSRIVALSWLFQEKSIRKIKRFWARCMISRPCALKIKRIPVSAVRVSPDDGNLLHGAVNDKGRYKIFVQDIRSGKPYKILAGGIKIRFRETDYSVPVFAWNKNNTDLTLITEKHDVWWLYTIDVQTGEYTKDKLSLNIKRVYQVDWIDDKTLLLNIYDALADLYTYLRWREKVNALLRIFMTISNASYGSLMGQKAYCLNQPRALDTLFLMPLDTLLPVQPFNLYFIAIRPDHGIQSKNWSGWLIIYIRTWMDQPAISVQNQINYLDDESE